MMEKFFNLIETYFTFLCKIGFLEKSEGDTMGFFLFVLPFSSIILVVAYNSIAKVIEKELLLFRRRMKSKRGIQPAAQIAFFAIQLAAVVFILPRRLMVLIKTA